MTTLYWLAGVLLVLALTLTVLLVEAYRAGQRWPLLFWFLFIGAVVTDALILKSESVWWWLSIFW